MGAAMSFTVKSGQTISDDYVDMVGRVLMALEIPTGYAEGNISFKGASTKDGVYNDVYDSAGNKITVTVGGASRIVSLTGAHFQALASLTFIKLVTTSAAGADRVINVISHNAK
jgi:hypothetical protein